MSVAAPDQLDAGLIRKAMTPALQSKLGQLTLLQETDSTNTALLRLPGERQHAHAVLAERQTSGRGRRQKSWHSPPGGNIYLSLGWWFRKSERPLSALPLVVAIAACRALGRAGLQGHGIKWPNDILSGGKKLAGILVELQSAGAGPALAVVGLGLNVRMPREDGGELAQAIDQPWTDLVTELEAECRNSGAAGTGRNRLVALLLDEMLGALEFFEANGFQEFTHAWRERDLLQGKDIQLQQNGSRISGKARGVDCNGGLLVETADAGLQVFHSGEVSVRYG